MTSNASDCFLKALEHRMRTIRGSVIYGLFDSGNELRYIGLSEKSAHSRFAQHRSTANTAYGCPGVNRLLRDDPGVVVRVLEHCYSSTSRERERWWIAWAIRIGCRLVNVHGCNKPDVMDAKVPPRKLWPK